MENNSEELSKNLNEFEIWDEFGIMFNSKSEEKTNGRIFAIQRDIEISHKV